MTIESNVSLLSLLFLVNTFGLLEKIHVNTVWPDDLKTSYRQFFIHIDI